MKYSIAFYTLGCKLNFSETSSIARLFQARGYQKVAFEEKPDVYVINTCSVTDNADKKCRKVVRDALSTSPEAFIFIVGCYAQLKPKEIATIPGVTAVLGAAEKFQLADILQDLIEKSKKTSVATICNTPINQVNDFNAAYSLHDRTRTFLKVQDGCNYNCSFCTIPLARGKSRSDTIDNIVNSAQKITEEGVKEIVITGVNTGDFGIRQGRRKERFIDLLKALDQVLGVERYRISSIEPNLLEDQIIEFVANSNRFVPHFHIPLQSGSDQILQRMHRRYRTSLYKERVHKIKDLMPDACIGVDVIVGFPGEGEAEFQTTYQFLKDLPISYLHVFSYSPRPNTAAFSMENQVAKTEISKRSKMLRSLSHKKRRYFYEENMGSVQEVLFEKDVEDGFIHGFTQNYIRVATPFDPDLINEKRTVQLKSINTKGIVEVSQLSQEPIFN